MNESLRSFFFLSFAFFFLLSSTCPAKQADGVKPNATLALNRLLEGNQRYMRSKMQHPDQSHERLKEVSKEQHPFAAIFGCADSRVPPEIIFDQGLGDLFVVREAGNIVDDAVLGSIEYAVGHLHVPLIVVLGHKRCGAIEAAVHGLKEDHITSIVHAIEPVIPLARKKGGDLVDSVVRENVIHVRSQISASPSIASAIASEKVKVMAGYYDLDSGKVEFIKINQQ